MRIRTIKPEFFTSPDTARASVEARLLYIALWCMADDYGIGEANMNAILGGAFPEDDQRTRTEIQCLCTEVAECYGTVFYTVRGRRYYAIPSWDNHQVNQRRAKRRNPGPDDEDAAPDLRIHGDHGASVSTHGDSVQTHGKHRPGTGEQGNRGTGETPHSPPRGGEARDVPEPAVEDEAPVGALPAVARTSAPAVADTPAPRARPAGKPQPRHPERFEEFWATYPTRKAKPRAIAAWNRAVTRDSPDRIIAAIPGYVTDCHRNRRRFQHPATWLNGDAWLDEPEHGPDTTAPPTARQQRRAQQDDLLARFAASDGSSPAPGVALPGTAGLTGIA